MQVSSGAATDGETDDAMTGADGGTSPPARPTWLGPVAVVGGYALVTLVLFWPVLRHLDGRVVGTNTLDDTTYQWGFQWLVHAVSHAQNPYLTSMQFANVGGLNATSYTSVLFPAAVFAPVTAIWGPVVATNLAMILSPFAAATSTFVLLRRWSTTVGAGLGGFVYGFSAFTMVQLLGHLNLVVATALLPALVLVFSTSPGSRRRQLALGTTGGALVWGLLHTSSEFLATTMMVGVGVLAVSVIARVVPFRAVREWVGLRRSLLVAALVVFAVLAIPFAWFFVRGPEAFRGVPQPRGVYQTDLAALVVPTSVELLAPPGNPRDLSAEQQADSLRGVHPAVDHPWSGNPGEWAGYLGLPLVLLTGWTLVRWRRSGTGERVAGLAIVGCVVLSLGSPLHVNGSDTKIPLPWWVLERIPFIRSALPARLMVFAFFAGACLVALQFAPGRGDKATATGRALAVLAAVCLVPAVPAASMPFNGYPGIERLADIPACTGDRSAVLFLPFDQPATALGAQAVDGFRFRLARGLGYRSSSNEWGPLLVVDRPFLLQPTDIATDDIGRARTELETLGTTCIVLPASVAARSPGGVGAVQSVAGGAGPRVVGGYLVWARPDGGWGAK